MKIFCARHCACVDLFSEDRRKLRNYYQGLMFSLLCNDLGVVLNKITSIYWSFQHQSEIFSKP